MFTISNNRLFCIEPTDDKPALDFEFVTLERFSVKYYSAIIMHWQMQEWCSSRSSEVAFDPGWQNIQQAADTDFSIGNIYRHKLHILCIMKSTDVLGVYT